MKKNKLLNIFKDLDLLKILSICAILCGAFISAYSANCSLQKWINNVNMTVEKAKASNDRIDQLECKVSQQGTDIEVVKNTTDLILKNQENQEAFLRQIVVLLKK